MVDRLAGRLAIWYILLHPLYIFLSLFRLSFTLSLSWLQSSAAILFSELYTQTWPFHCILRTKFSWTASLMVVMMLEFVVKGLVWTCLVTIWSKMMTWKILVLCVSFVLMCAYIWLLLKIHSWLLASRARFLFEFGSGHHLVGLSGGFCLNHQFFAQLIFCFYY